MQLKQWPPEEKPREKLLQRGAQALSDAELLALLLGTGTKHQDVLSFSRYLIQTFGSLRGLLQAPQEAMCQQSGLGPARCARLKAAIEIAKRCWFEELTQTSALTNTACAQLYLRACFSDQQREHFGVLLLNAQHQVLYFRMLFHGSINSASVCPGEVVKFALQHNASAVIIAHNHPGGYAEPSQEDLVVTKNIKHALALVNIHLLDHFIIGASHCVSLAERGLLQSEPSQTKIFA